MVGVWIVPVPSTNCHWNAIIPVESVSVDGVSAVPLKVKVSVLALRVKGRLVAFPVVGTTPEVKSIP